MAALDEVRRLVPLDHGLAVVVCRRPDLTPATSVVNAGVVPHPVTGADSLAFVSVGSAHRLAYLRADPTISVVVRAGWEWAAVEGTALLVGPEDPLDGVDTDRLRLVLREIFSAAGGSHEDWDEYDRVMRAEGRTAVFVEERGR